MGDPPRRGPSAELTRRARIARERAYSPYSGIRVGAAVLSEDGQIHSGCNVENASYGLTQCAERVALGAAIAAGVAPGHIRELLVVTGDFRVLSPCGACRQVMHELLAEDALVHSCNDSGVTRTWSMAELLPSPFVLE